MKFGDLMEEKAGTGQDGRLEPAWKKSASNSYTERSIQHGSNGVMKKKLNPLGAIWKKRVSFVGPAGIL